MTQTSKPVRRRGSERDGPSPLTLHNRMQVELVETSQLRLNPESAKRWSRMENKITRQIVAALKVIPPLLADNLGVVAIGEVILHAAKELGITHLPVIRSKG